MHPFKKWMHQQEQKQPIYLVPNLSCDTYLSVMLNRFASGVSEELPYIISYCPGSVRIVLVSVSKNSNDSFVSSNDTVRLSPGFNSTRRKARKLLTGPSVSPILRIYTCTTSAPRQLPVFSTLTLKETSLPTGTERRLSFPSEMSNVV